MSIHLFNTMGRKMEEFQPLKKGRAGMYTCGPTVYNFAHIGNLRSYVFEDVLKRVLRHNGYKVKHVMNITDVGHLTSDADEGEDKMEKGARREGKSAWDIARFYTQSFKEDLAALNIEEPDIWCRATDHIREQIKLIKKLEKKGFTYQTMDGIYFDTSKLTDYGKLANLKKQELRAGVRVDVGDKKNIHDFALWKFSPKLSQRQMEWRSPWGVGFPGWHIECSAMSEKYLGQPFDIHCGGIDHIPVHHTNEIAQSEAANGRPLANYWLHGEFLLSEEGKMAKSAGNFITLSRLIHHKYDAGGIPACLAGRQALRRDKFSNNDGFNPLAYRYLLLQTHYRKQLSFSWQALQAAQKGLEHLYHSAIILKNNDDNKLLENEKIRAEFLKRINNDLDIPAALALIWETIKEKRLNLSTLLSFDEVLGLKIKEGIKQKSERLPDEAEKIISDRDLARRNKDWVKSDALRLKLEQMGYDVEDYSDGTRVHRK